MRCRILGLTLLLSTTVLVHVAAAQQVADAAPSLRPADDIITPGQILLHRTEAALPPETQTSWEERLKQQMAEAQQTLKAQNAEQLNKMRDENARLQQQLTAQQMLVAESTRARNEATQARLQSIADVTAARLTAYDRVADAKMEALAQNTNTKLTGLAQIAETESKLNDARQQATSAQVAALSGEFERKLNYYATEQLAQTRRDTDAELQKVAKNARLDVLALQTQTATKLAEIRDTANRKAAAMADARAAAVEQKLVTAIEGKTSPAEVKALARDQLADAAPEMRALALQTLSDSQDYIKTVAKDAVKDGDPAVQEALQNAARSVIAKDNKVVFAMRQAMAQQIADEAAGKPIPGVTDGTTPLPDTIPGSEGEGAPAMALGNALGNDINIDPATLKITAPAAGAGTSVPQVLASLGGQKTSLLPARNRRDWVDLRKYHVVVHEDGKTLEELLGEVMKRAEPFTGPWKLKWKISNENKDILTTRFSLDTETNFADFVGYLAQYLVNDRGVKITFSMFDRDRVLVISD